MEYTRWFSSQIDKCVEKEASKSTMYKKTLSDMTEYELLELVRTNVRCYYSVLAKMGEKRFQKMLDEMMEPIIKSGKEIDNVLFSYFSKFVDPREIMKQNEVVQQVTDVAVDEMSRSIDDQDPRLMSRLFVLSYLNEVRFTILLASMRPLLDILSVADAACKLDLNWAVSLISLVLEEAMVKRKLRETGHEPGANKPFHRLTDSLRDALRAKGEQPSQDLLLSDGFRNVRHEIVHDPEAWKATPEQTHEYVRHVVALAKSLWPDLQLQYSSDAMHK